MKEMRDFCFILVPNFSLLAFSSAIEPLRAANNLAGREVFRWSLASPDGAPVIASNGARMAVDHGVRAMPPDRYWVVCSGLDGQRFNHKPTMAQLRRHVARGGKVGALSDGAFILAKAGLLANRRCVVHWRCVEGFRETYPDIAVSTDIFQDDGPVFSASGGTAPMDLMLFLIARQQGQALADEVAAYFLHERIRSDTDIQLDAARSGPARRNRHLSRAIGFMQENLEESLSIGDIAGAIGLSDRQLMRIFKRYFGKSVMRFCTELRLEKARLLLRQTPLSVSEVACACGFQTFSNFTKNYREHFGNTPREERSMLTPSTV